MELRTSLSDDSSASILLEMKYSRRPEDLSYTNSATITANNNNNNNTINTINNPHNPHNINIINNTNNTPISPFTFTFPVSSSPIPIPIPIPSPQQDAELEIDEDDDGVSASQKSARRTLYGNEWGTKNTASTYGHCLATTCMLCDRGCPSLLFKSPTWANIMRVVFYCLKYDYPNKPFFSLKNDVYQFMVEHWNKLCLNKKRSDNWHKQIQDMLSHSKNVFESGVNHFKQNGFWRLRQLTDPWTLDRETAIISKKASPPESPCSPMSQPSSSPKRSAEDTEEEEVFMSPKRVKVSPPSSPSAELAPQISSMALPSSSPSSYLIPSLASRSSASAFGSGKSPVSALLNNNNDTPSIGLSVSLYNEDILHQQLSAMASSLVNIQSELASGPSIQPYTIYHSSNRTTAIES